MQEQEMENNEFSWSGLIRIVISAYYKSHETIPIASMVFNKAPGF